jgi:type IV pilus assembly protein PilW
MQQRRGQRGFTLTELMITIGISMSIISSVLIGYLATYSSSLSTLAGSKLNQDMSALMSLMGNELRRAGYYGAVAASPAANPFSQVDDTALEVFDSIAGNAQQAATGNGTCIVFAYDLDEDGVVDANELGGFRLNGSTVEMRTAGNLADPDSCASAGNTWMALTDPNFITITTLDFDLGGSECLNTAEPDGADSDGDTVIDNPEEYDCYAQVPAAGSNAITVETRQVDITLTGNLANDAFVRLAQTQSIKVRNDMVRVR